MTPKNVRVALATLRPLTWESLVIDDGMSPNDDATLFVMTLCDAPVSQSAVVL